MRKELTEEQLKIDLIFKRIRDIYGFYNNTKMLSYFNLSESFCSQSIGRASIPWKLIDSVSKEKNISLDYLVHGKKLIPLVEFNQYDLAVSKGLFKAKMFNVLSNDKEIELVKGFVLTALGDVKPDFNILIDPKPHTVTNSA